ncbi:ribokinase [Neoroseomonas oryzicola]|uniref:ribokinase n=1 Tax=Neoroseomonas oryzicola TaxID=535904 RepID=UPI001ADF9E1C|nr:ribokinase [Neoroseomonas oryzicola]
MGRILVVGSYNQDTVLRVPRFPKPGETLAATALEHFHGGKGSNQAVAAARSGAEVTLAACIGRDAAGDAALALWAGEGIDATAVRREAGAPTGTALILLDAAGENEIVILAGANARLAPEDARPAAAGAALVVAQLETPVEATIAAFLAARAAGGRTLLNAAPAGDLPAALLAATDILVVNETEAERLAGKGGAPSELAAALAPRFGSGVVLTAGAAGAFWAGRDGGALHLPAPPTQVADSTGAGDAFVGAMAAALAEGLPMEGALRRGVIAGSLACRSLGAVPSLPRRAEILAAQ